MSAFLLIEGNFFRGFLECLDDKTVAYATC